MNVEGLTLIGIGMAFVVFSVLAYFLLILAAIVLTFASIYGWTRDLTIGSLTIRKEYSRAFIPMGVLGEIAVALFITFVEGLGVAVDAAWVPYMLGGAYAAVAIGGTALLEKIDVWPRDTKLGAVPARAAIETPAEKPVEPSFTYVEWDDDHIRR
jgi:hypothetical protein